MPYKMGGMDRIGKRGGAMPYRTRLQELKLKMQADKGDTITWQEIADEVGIALSTIQRYVHEPVSRPDYSVIDRLAIYFDVPIRDLIYLEEEQDPQLVAVAVG
jgi:transcriptional regulator with XRE-family HTH domain